MTTSNVIAETALHSSRRQRGGKRRPLRGPPAFARSVTGEECFAWWRTHPISVLRGRMTRRLVEEAVVSVSVPANPIWFSARAGAASSAISLAMRTVSAASPLPSYYVDIVMTMLLRCVLTGDAAAELVFGYILRRFARKAPAPKQLTDEHLARNRVNGCRP